MSWANLPGHAGKSGSIVSLSCKEVGQLVQEGSVPGDSGPAGVLVT